MKKNQGFTLIELVIVIVIFGILSAVALPKFVIVNSDARIASLNALAGGIRSVTALAKAQYFINGDSTLSAVSMGGQEIDVVAGHGQPNATTTGIHTALNSISGFNITHTDGISIFQPTNGGGAHCRLTYTQATANVALSLSNC